MRDRKIFHFAYSDSDKNPSGRGDFLWEIPLDNNLILGLLLNVSMKKLFSFLVSFSFFSFLASGVAFAAVTGDLLPVSDGNYSQWTPSTGSTHATLVDESSCNGKTDYVSTSTTNNRDSYGLDLSSIPNGATITQIDLTPCASKNANGGSNSTGKVFYRSNGVNSADSAGYSLSGTTPVGLSTTSYTGLSTVKSGSTTLESGFVFTAGAKGARLSRLVTVVTYTPLVAPTNLVATASTQTKINLTWTDNATNETGYTIEQSPNGVDSWTVAVLRGPNATFQTIFNLSPGTTYYYRVYATNSGGQSGYSNVSSATTYFGVPTVTTLDSTSITTNSASLRSTINTNRGDTTYQYRYGTTNVSCDEFSSVSSSGFITAGTVDVSPNARVVTPLLPATTYYFCAVGTNASGTAYGDVLSFATL